MIARTPEYRPDRAAVLFVLCAMIAVALGTASVASAEITLRNGQRILDPIERISIEGIAVRTTTTRLIGWEMVRSVDGPRASDAAHFMPLAERAWRARTRLDRDDLTLARPLLETLFEEVGTREGSVALLAAEGLLRCRLAEAEPERGVRPWIEAARLRAAWDAGDHGAGEPHLLDRATLLCPALPPFFTAEQARELLDDLIAHPRDQAPSDPAAHLMAWYHRAASFDAGAGSLGA